MSEYLPPGDDVIVCPICKTINQPNMIVCVSCGIRFDTFEGINQQWQKRLIKKEADRLQQLTAKANRSLKDTVKKSHRNFAYQLIGLVATSILVVIVVWIIDRSIDLHNQYIVQRLQEKYDQGTVCFDRQDYLCARDAYLWVYLESDSYLDVKGRLMDARLQLAEEYLSSGQPSLAVQELNSVLEIEPNHPGVLKSIYDIRISLALQYIAADQWSHAIQEIEKALEISPENPSALRLLSDTYEDWYNETLNKRNYLKAWSIKREWNARFPDK